MNNIFKLVFGLAILTLVLASASSVLAATLVADISAPTTGASVNVGQTVTLTGVATGGTGTYPSFRWAFSDGTTSKIGQNQTVSFGTAGSKTITLTVTDSEGATSVKSVNVTVNTTATGKPVITGIATSNITQTGVTITWTTDIPATSRVIYDTVSHPTLGTGDNFGYAISSPEITAKTTTHSVTLSGLNPGTKYYFRVISQG